MNIAREPYRIQMKITKIPYKFCEKIDNIGQTDKIRQIGKTISPAATQ